MEGWRKFLNEGEQDLDPEYREYDYESQSQQDWERSHPYVDPDDDTTMDAEEPVNQKFKIGQRVEVHSIEDDDKLQASSEGKAWDNAGIWYGSRGSHPGFEVIVDDYSPGAGYTLVDTEDLESKLYGVSEDNIREVGNGPDYRMSRSYEQDLEDWSRNNPYEDEDENKTSFDKEELYSWARSRAQGMKFKK